MRRRCYHYNTGSGRWSKAHVSFTLLPMVNVLEEECHVTEVQDLPVRDSVHRQFLPSQLGFVQCPVRSLSAFRRFISADNGMSVPIFFLFLTDLSLAQHSHPNSHGLRDKEAGRGRSGSAILSDIDDRDTFCKGNVNAVFPDPYAYNVYYRCRRNRRETWKCIGDLYFDWKTQKCGSISVPQIGSSAGGVCYQQQDGVQPLYATGCTNYVRCKGGVAVDEKQCRSNELFSYSLQSCRSSSEVSCVESFCMPNNDGFFILPGSKCRAYYLCRKGLRLSFLCPGNQIFDLQTKRCVDGGICYEPVCIGRTDGIYPDTTHNCLRYFRCTGGKLMEVSSCPKYFKHNGFACLPADGVRCDGPEKTAAVIYYRANDECKLLRDGTHIVPGTDCTKIRVCEGGRTVETSQCPINYRFNGRECFHRELTECEDSCSEKPDGYHPDESKDCHEYFYCFNETIRERKKCEEGTSFDGQHCSPAQLVTCTKERDIEHCEGLSNGYHADYLKGCRNYFYCHDQQTIWKGSCPEGMKWSGTYCTDNFTCESPAPFPQCKGALTGLYQDVLSNCTNYIYCKNGLGTILSCPDGQVHDRSKCRNREDYTCPSVARDECYNQPDGYRQDEMSNCRSYFFCAKGTKITYVCDDGFIFNGTRCVSPKVYACPFVTTDCAGKYDGYYPDETTSCNKFFYCFNDTRVTTISCEGGKIFNGESCIFVEDARAACSKATSNPCHRRRDGTYFTRCEKHVVCRRQEVVQEKVCQRGTICSTNLGCSSKSRKGKDFMCDTETTAFVPDYGSGCKNYYFCLKNIKMVATCPSGTIFNGRVCQDENTYKCPKGSWDI